MEILNPTAKQAKKNTEINKKTARSHQKFEKETTHL